MSENDLIKNIVAKKFTKANTDFADMMRNKVYKVVDDFKKGFKYVTHDKAPEPQEKTDG